MSHAVINNIKGVKENKALGLGNADRIGVAETAFQVGVLKKALSPGALLLNGEKSVSVLGDSITFGQGAGDLFSHSWAAIFSRMVAVHYGNENIGFIPFQVTGETQIHNISAVGTWSGLSHANADHTLNGYARTTTSGTARLEIAVKPMTTAFDVWWTRQPGGGTFGVYVNGILQNTVDTDGGTAKAGWYRNANYPMTPDSDGLVKISIRANGDGPIELLGIGYNSDDGIRLQNWSQPGRKAQFLGNSVIDHAANGAKALILALGHNDQNAQGADLDTALERLDRVLERCRHFNTPLIVIDFIWDRDYTNPIKAKLKEIGEAAGSRYIEFSRFFNSDGTLPTSAELQARGLLVDSSHPSPQGHQMIAETVAAMLGMNATSKAQCEPKGLWRSLRWVGFEPLFTGASVTDSYGGYQNEGDFVSLVVRAKVSAVSSDLLVTVPSGAAPHSDLYSGFGMESQLMPAQLISIGSGVVSSACQFTSEGTLKVRNTAAMADGSEVHINVRYRAK